MWTEQNRSSFFKINNDSIVTFYFFLSKVGKDAVSVRYRCSITSITICQITIIDSITKKMYEKKVHFYRYRIVIDILLTMYRKKVHFYRYQINIELLLISLTIYY
jgi:hypothetical protein